MEVRRTAIREVPAHRSEERVQTRRESARRDPIDRPPPSLFGDRREQGPRLDASSARSMVAIRSGDLPTVQRHTVKDGETLEGIARAHYGEGGDTFATWALAAYNGLPEPGAIRPGLRL